ncbi:thiol-disulfide isomerase, partial [Candidatus Sumerlaeota bacterium]|nr:thiol-disulfide isomerase [Candidatus Sumerlaeota bacterium]
LPHMHLRGKDMKVWAKFPDGTEKDIIWVPKYDFNWQTIYEMKKPLFLPKGTKLYAKAHYNNSASNPNNPDPNAAVHFGEETTAEMMFAFLSYTLPGENLGKKDPSFILVGSAGQ